MKSQTLYLFAADVILATHVLVVAFVIFGLVVIYAGKYYSWSWIRNPWFRLAHLSAIVIVMLQSWMGMICPLTTWEMSLRAKADGAVYAGTFISHWLESLLYYSAPSWVFILCYTVVALLVLVSWFKIRPRSFTTTGKHAAKPKVAEREQP